MGVPTFETRHVGQVEIEQYDVVVIELAEVHAFLAEIGGVNIEAFGLQHQLNALGRCGIVLDQQYSHLETPFVRLPGGAFSVAQPNGQRALHAQLSVNSEC